MANGLQRHESETFGNLPRDSYTAHRLADATPEHLHLTSRRCFIGPIPKGWIDSHKKSWVTAKIKRNYRNRSATFTASENTSDGRRVSGLSEASPEQIRQSFQQPQDVQSDSVVQGGHADLVARLDHGNGSITEEPAIASGSQHESASKHEAARPDKGSPISNPHLEILARSTGNKRSSSTDRRHLSHNGSANGGSSLAPENTNAETASSTTSLLRQVSREVDDGSPVPGVENTQPKPKGILAKVTRSRGAQPNIDDTTEAEGTTNAPAAKNHIRFDVSQDGTRAALLMRARMGHSQLRQGVGSVLKRNLTDGAIIKMEKMLVRIDTTSKSKLPSEYDENSSQGVVSTIKQKWREYMIVVRQNLSNEVSDFVLQAYKTRVIPASEKGQRKKPEFEVHLESKKSNLNMYSSLDKSLVLWTSDSHGTLIYTLQCRTTSSSVEWLTFLRGIYGLQRPSEILISIPGIDINLKLQDPFRTLEGQEEGISGENEEELLACAESKEAAVAPMIVSRCVDMLNASPETADILDTWQHGQRIGLAWKRYDRLEWIHGVQEKKMFGAMAMTQSHDLELRPKQHYPTVTTTKKGKSLTEPPGVEGFLIQLTSQKGKQKSMGRSYFSRLYFATFDQFLFFGQPRNSEPPTPPPGVSYDQGMSSKQLSEQIPIIYAVNPYPVDHDRITWTNSANSTEVKARNEQAEEEATRREKVLQSCEGFINLCDVVKVRKVHHDAAEVIVRPEEEEPDSEHEDSGTEDQGQIGTDDGKTFELVLKNGLIVRLRAYDTQTKKEWKKRLRALVKYWRWRHQEDIQLFHKVRSRNLHELQVDEEGEALVGQFARKWELSQTFASPEMYNFCGISGCRTINLSGPLYSKPRLHGNFTLSHCLLVPGHMLLFESALRATSGKVVRHVHHSRRQIIDLEDCYLYTGLLTEGDLLYHNTTFDANSPGHHALPRMWPEDGWDNWDEDIMTCFVLWKPAGKSWYREKAQGKRAKLKRVSTLGKKGNRIVFRARSRAERDRWVLAIANEIEKQVSGEQQQVRVVGDRAA